MKFFILIIALLPLSAIAQTCNCTLPPDQCCTIADSSWWFEHGSRGNTTWPTGCTAPNYIGENTVIWDRVWFDFVDPFSIHAELPAPCPGLALQYIKAVLNHCKGACIDSNVGAALVEATAILYNASVCPLSWPENSPTWDKIAGLTIVLQHYNYGFIGPGECDICSGGCTRSRGWYATFCDRGPRFHDPCSLINEDTAAQVSAAGLKPKKGSACTMLKREIATAHLNSGNQAGGGTACRPPSVQLAFDFGLLLLSGCTFQRTCCDGILGITPPLCHTAPQCQLPVDQLEAAPNRHFDKNKEARALALEYAAILSNYNEGGTDPGACDTTEIDPVIAGYELGVAECAGAVVVRVFVHARDVGPSFCVPVREGDHVVRRGRRDRRREEAQGVDGFCFLFLWIVFFFLRGRVG
jgi:hypothetical protein